MTDELQEAEAPGRRSLYQQIRRARFWFPLAIVCVVAFYQLVVVPLGGAVWQFWSQLLFYSIVGPAVTFMTLNWIAQQVREREHAQFELRKLYGELRRSHELLAAIQKVTEQFAAAPDLEAVLSAATNGITDASGARGVAVHLGAGEIGLRRSHALDKIALEDAERRDKAVAEGVSLPPRAPDGAHVLSMAIRGSARTKGSIHAYFDGPPTSEQEESFRILAAEFSAAAEAARSRTRDILTLFEVDRSIRAEGNLERLLGTLLTQMMRRVEARLGAVYLADEGGLLQLRAWRGLSRAPEVTAVRLGEGLIGAAALQVEPRISSRLDDAARSRGGPILERAGSAVSLPMTADEGLVGIIVLAHENEHHFDETSLPFLSLLAGQVSAAVRNARAYIYSEELAIAEERARIAREIHDGVAQSLAFAALKLDLVVRLVESDVNKALTEIKEAKTTIREMIREIRRSIFALRPVDLERHGFLETVRRFVSDYGQQNNIRVDLVVESLPPLSLKSEATLFRIFQEAMNNVAKHASAHTVTVTIGTTSEGHAFITVEDDGVGFDPSDVSDRVTSAGGLGLKQMRERMASRGGTFRLSSEPGRGTSVYAALPE